MSDKGVVIFEFKALVQTLSIVVHKESWIRNKRKDSATAAKGATAEVTYEIEKRM